MQTPVLQTPEDAHQVAVAFSLAFCTLMLGPAVQVTDVRFIGRS